MGKVPSPIDSLRRHLRKLTISSIVIILVIAGFFTWLFLYFSFGDDLILNLEANQTSFTITNADVAPVRVTVDTSGQLFCKTDCTLALLDANSHSVNVENFILSNGESRSFDYALTPGQQGTGQSLYSVVASCQNVRSPLCPTLAPERRKTVLLTVNYGLATDEAQVKPALEEQLTQMLTTLRAADILLQQVTAVAATPGLRAGYLIPRMTLLQEGFAEHHVFLENAKLLWAQEAYLPLANLLLISNTTNESIGSMLANATVLRDEILSLPQQHNALRLRIDDVRTATRDIVVEYYPLIGNGTANATLRAAAADANLLVDLYAQELFPDYEALNASIALAESNVLLINASMQQLLDDAVRMGNAVIAAAEELQCNCTNVTSNMTAIADICANLTAAANSTALYISTYCVERNDTVFVNMTILAPMIVQVQNVTSTVNATLPEAMPTCCVFGECKACCSTCSDEAYPVIFVHGHSFNSFNSPEYSLGGYFTKIQQRLQEEGYVDAGILTPSSTLGEVAPGEWGVSGRPVTVRVSYYYNFYRSGTDYVMITQKSENIETYAIRLNELVNTVQHHTGKKKVKIVAHSMGGLVVRRYMQLFGEENVDVVIMVGTPNAGITARTRTLCPVFGESKECEDMTNGSVLMRKLNDPGNLPEARMVTITGHGCAVGEADGDGVVEAASVPLEFAKNYDVNGTCSDLFGAEFHTEMLNVDKYPEVYEIIRDELK